MEKTGVITDVFKRYYDQNPILLLILNKHGIIIYRNPLMDNWLDGFDSSSEYVSIYDVIHKEEQGKLSQYLMKVMEPSSQAFSFDTRWARKQKVKYVRLHVAAIEENGETYIIVNLQDITEQKQVQSLWAMKKSALEMIVRRESLSRIFQVLSTNIEQHNSRITYCSILLLDDSRKRVEYSIAPNLPESFSQSLVNLEIGPNKGSCGTAMYQKELVIVEDIASDPSWQRFRQTALSFGLRSCWSLPIFVDGEVIGSFALYHPEPSSPTSHEIEIIECCAYLAGLAVERSKIEDRMIEEQERRFKVLINALPDLVVFKDRDGRWMEINNAALERFPALQEVSYQGKTNHELIEMFPKKRTFFEHSEKNDHLVWETGKAVRTEWDFVLHNHEMMTIDMMNVPIFGSTGMREGLLVIGRDITERKMAGLRLEESEQKYKSLFEHNPGGIYSMDLQGRITSFNAAMQRILGFTNEDYYNRFSLL